MVHPPHTCNRLLFFHLQMEALEALLEHERGEGRAREQRHKLTVERLRRQISDLQARKLAMSCAAKLQGRQSPADMQWQQACMVFTVSQRDFCCRACQVSVRQSNFNLPPAAAHRRSRRH